ncbi:autoinducer 2 ABC transporter substrate-binding protein [Pengzhenrongella sicca]|uniref:Autoinducer 2 ABC transporter substrate-binding protein n=1 Tax=Pengzhenrongella sicca TaxID=2819238 RepID=A0A8A4Z807_9MICO|nr:autoinducer 2 ABC transporter substrate-binding protein [Pengzhenrongella sicca]QTE27954.1 autoinducer 2 ABC transporter substrate-binding protein [Pengzhenrongella sicca]
MSIRNRRRSRTILAAFAGAAVLAVSACSGSSDEPAAGNETSAAAADVSIFMAPKFTGLAYFEVARAGGERAGEELGIDFQYVGSDEPDATAQVQTLENSITQKPSALVVSAIDGGAVSPSLKKAMDAGIVVVTYDADAEVDARDIFVNQLSYELAASTMLDAALLNDPEGGKIAFVSASPTAPNHTAHVKIMKELIDTDPAYSALSYIDTVQFAGDDEQKSFDIAVNLMQDPDLKFIISSSAATVPAAAQAVVAQGRQGEVYATGFALPSSMKEFVADGSVKAFALWDPAELGYVATMAANQLVTGEITSEEGQVVKAGDAGDFTVGADGELLYDKPLVFTAENIDEYDF